MPLFHMNKIRYKDELKVKKAGTSLVIHLTKPLKLIGCSYNDTVVVTVEDNKIIIEKKGFRY